jgi:hypothetical protein
MHPLNEIMGLAGTACTQCNPPAELSPLGRWCDNKDGTVTDMTTGLVWLQQADWGGEKPWEDCTTHNDAHTRAGTLYDGLPSGDADLTDDSVEGDWRLPTLEELKALTTTDTDEFVSSGGMRAFSGVRSAYYWSSTARSDITGVAWDVHLSNGSVFYDDKSIHYNVWPVRGP